MRTRVVEPHNHKRTLVNLISVALVADVIAGVWWGKISGAGPLPLLLLIIPLILALLLPRRTQDPTWCLVYGAVVGGMLVSVPILCWAVALTGVTPLLRAEFIRALLLVAVSTAIAAACALVLWMLAYRFLRVRHIQQDGTMCPNCGYCIQHLPSATCPECGGTFDRAHLAAILDRKSGRLVGRTWKRAVWIVAVVVGMLVAGYHWRRGSITSLTLLNPLYWEHIIADALYWEHVIADDGADGATYPMSLVWQLDKETLTPDEVRSIVGPPDLFLVDDTGTFYIYEYRINGRDLVVYVKLVNGQPVRVGTNLAGVNDHSRYKPWPQKRGMTTPASP